MKKLLLLTLFIPPVLYSCSDSKTMSESNRDAQITLDLGACSDSVAIIEMFDFNKMNFVTKAAGDKGNFKLTAPLNKDAAYLISVGEIKIPFVYDGKDLVFKGGSCSDLEGLSVSGSSNTQSLLSFMDKVEDINVEIGKSKSFYDSLLVNNVADTITKSAKLVLDNKHQEMNQYIKSYIDSVNHFQLALYALEYLNPITELTFFEKFTKSINKRFPKNAIADSFKSMFISNIENINKTEVKVGDMAPDFTLQNLSGGEVSLSESRGKYVYLDFWASFCSPCRTESKNKIKISKEFSGQNFEMISVSLDQNESKWKNAIAKDSLNWVHLIEPNSWDSRLNEMYNLDKIPTNYLIDPSGKIIAKNLSMEELHDKLESIMTVQLGASPELTNK